MMDQVIDWLLQGPTYVQYRTRVDLLEEMEESPMARSIRQKMLCDPQVTTLVEGLSIWPGEVISSHKSAGQPYHRLNFLVDLGLRIDDPGLKELAEKIMAHQSAQGPFQLVSNTPVHYGGTGKDEWGWALCDAPLLLYALVKLGLGEDSRVRSGVSYLMGLARENGWPCAVSPELGKFRGPGRKDDPCPYANLAMLKLLALKPEWRDSPEGRIGVETQLRLWETRADSHPYMFYIGTDFCKLKAPLVWYDILHVLDVLSFFPWVRDDCRLEEMLSVLKSKADADRRYTPESVWTAWKDWEFGQKKTPSRWVSLLALRVFKRLGYPACSG